jgi:hypothetical protein
MGITVLQSLNLCNGIGMVFTIEIDSMVKIHSCRLLSFCIMYLVFLYNGNSLSAARAIRVGWDA